MSTALPIPLTPICTFPGQADYQALLAWQFASQPFYDGQVQRLLRTDIPQRIAYGCGQLWVYKDPAGNAVGFGSLDVTRDYDRFTEGKYHCYVPVLAVNPAFQKRGHGRSVVQHLIAEAALVSRRPADVSDLLFLDTYTANTAAIALYEKCGFVTLNPDCPILDPLENNEPYVIMARTLAIGTG